jgi:hypothetical protein
MIELCKIKIIVHAGIQEYGFSCNFNSGFNVIRADNSQGKSTLIAAILYGLGFEEILGGKNEVALPHALRASVLEANSLSGNEITSSEVWIEYKNGNKVKTNRRSITNKVKSGKLIEVYDGPFLSEPNAHYTKKDYYIHDKNSAQSIDAGYFSYIESFCGFKLPDIIAPDGRTSKLYIQYIAASSLIEQRLGWTAYLANLPYFGIKDAKQKTIEFILGLSALNKDSERRTLQSRLSEIQSKWIEVSTRIRSGFENDNLAIQGLSPAIDSSFMSSAVTVVKPSSDGPIEVNEYLEMLREEFMKIEENQLLVNGASDFSQSEEIESLITKQRALSDMERRQIFTQRTLISENTKLEKSFKDIEADLARNKAAKKIRDLGGEFDLNIANTHCPICSQEISDDIDIMSMNFHTMSLDENIKYIESQKTLIKSSIASNNAALDQIQPQLQDVRTRIADTNNRLNRIRREISYKEGAISESAVYRKVKIENEIESISQAISRQLELFPTLEQISKESRSILDILDGLKSDKISNSDAEKIRNFAIEIRKLLRAFKFASFSPELVVLDDEKITPIVKYKDTQTDISGDSIKGISEMASNSVISKTEKAASASDFTRLIWAFTLALRTCASKIEATHLGLVIMDEPQQHSMDSESMRELFTECSKDKKQTIIAASFDCSETIYQEITKGIDFHLIKFEGKLLKKTL